MTGKDLNEHLERGVLDKSPISALSARGLEKPSDLKASVGKTDSVTQQYHEINATWAGDTKTLTLEESPGGAGWWIPYIGNGIPNLEGGTEKRGLGAYTPVIGPNDPVSWVVTGPFSGCHAYAFSSNAGKTFAHLVTPADGYTAETMKQQIADIAELTKTQVPQGGQILGDGLGYVFWTRIDGVWWQRIVYTRPGGEVMSVEPKVKIDEMAYAAGF